MTRIAVSALLLLAIGNAAFAGLVTKVGAPGDRAERRARDAGSDPPAGPIARFPKKRTARRPSRVDPLELDY